MTLQMALNFFCTGIIILATIGVIRSTVKINKASKQVLARIDELAQRVDRIERAGVGSRR